MADRNLQERMESILNRLSIPVAVVDREYDSSLVIEAKAEGVVFQQNGSKCLAVPKTHLALACKADVPGADEVLKLACELVSTLTSVSDPDT